MPLQGAPVTTVDFDFLFRKAPWNLRTLKAFARELDAAILGPYYPASDLYRVVRDADGLQVDFGGTIHGVRSFEGVRARATVIEIASVPILVASLADIIRSKRAAVAKESERNLHDLIRRWQALPPEQRVNFLRKRLGPGRSAL